MASVKSDTTIKEYQDFIKEIYGLPNDRYFSVWDMMTNIERFIMRGLKGIRKNDTARTNFNLLISLSWFASMMNQLHIDIENEVWKRFPFLCSYCAYCPCSCKEKKVDERQKVVIDDKKRPKTLKEFQDMFNLIYPASSRTLENAGIHLAEEMGEFSEAVLVYRGSRAINDLEKIELEAADLFSCFTGVYNSMKMSIANELSAIFFENCHACRKAPCECSFTDITKFKS